MVGRREAQGTVDRFQRLACLEAVKRKGPLSAEQVARWADLPVADAQRHLDALIHERRVSKQGLQFAVAG